MARKCAYTKEMILEVAIKLFKKEGSDAVTAKNIAKELGCSVAPIYSVYMSLDDLKRDLAFEIEKNILEENTNNEPKKEGANTAQYASKPNFSTETPLYWFRASETFFLKAEAALYGLISTGTAQSYYEQGVRQSFAEAGAGDATAYLAQTGVLPAATTVAYNPYLSSRYSDNISSGNVSPNWNDVDATRNLQEVQLQKIITQKFIANTPWLPLETWSDHRRLGLPFFETPAVEKALDNMPQLTASTYSTVSVDYYPQRLPLPSSIVNGNKPGYESAIKALGGEDKVFTPIYWAKKKQ